MAGETERQVITDFWPGHLEHLAPEGNRMGQAHTDDANGIVCNCGDVLGWPEDRMKQIMTDQAKTAEWTAEMHKLGQQAADTPAERAPAGQVVEHGYNPAMDQSAMAGADTEPHSIDDDPAVEAAKQTIRRPMQDNPSPEGARRVHEGSVQVFQYGEWMDLPPVQQARGYDGPPRPGDGEIYTDPSGTRWQSTAERPHPDDPRFSAETFGDLAPELFDQAEQFLSGDDPADEAQASRRPMRDVHLPEEPPVRSGTLPARREDVVVAEDPIAARVNVIDPTLPYGPADVEHQLIDIAARIERGTHFQREWEERHFRAKTAYELANAHALVNAKGGDAATRKAQALLDCRDEYLELAVCDTMMRAIRETMHNLRSLQSGYQTIARSVGASVNHPYGHGA